MTDGMGRVDAGVFGGRGRGWVLAVAGPAPVPRIRIT